MPHKGGYSFSLSYHLCDSFMCVQCMCCILHAYRDDFCACCVSASMHAGCGNTILHCVHTQVYHPNIDTEGNICLNILREDWKPVLSINSVVYGLNFLFLVRFFDCQIPATDKES